MILNSQRAVNADTALQLGRYFGTTPQLRLNLQKTWGASLGRDRDGPRDRQTRDTSVVGGVEE